MKRFAFMLVLAGSASAQIETATTAVRDTILRSFLVTGMPYSAQQVTEHVQVLADGTRITQTRGKQSDYRDSSGRTRTEHMAAQNPGSAEPAADTVSTIFILDPVADVRYILDPRTHVVTQSSLLPLPQSANGTPVLFVNGAFPPETHTTPGSRTATRPHLSRESESLGTRTIEGLTATGIRTTIVYPVGFYGNDRPFSTSTEIWTSPELNITVLQIDSDPRSGDTTTSVTNISRAEPDPSLFQVPPDYQFAAPMRDLREILP